MEWLLLAGVGVVVVLYALLRLALALDAARRAAAAADKFPAVAAGRATGPDGTRVDVPAAEPGAADGGA